MSIDKVSIVIVSWNGRQHLEHCLPALAAQEDPGVEVEILVLDNGSWDGTAEWMREHYPAVELVASPVNLGFCAGNNRLVERAAGDAVALLNNDTRPEPDWLRELVQALREAEEDVAAVSGLIVDWPGERLDFAGGLVTFDGHAFQKDYYRPLGEVALPEAGVELPFACGGNMLVRRQSFLDAGGFDESYFAYLEDVDLGWRLWSGGERIVFAPKAVVHHRSMATSDLLGNANRGFLFERNAFATVYKNLEEDLWRKLMPSILLTLTHRTQTLLVQNNPGGEQLTVDPYAGLIANTAHPTPAEPPSAAASAAAVPPPAPEPPREPTLLEKWKGYGPKDFLRRGLRKAVRGVLPEWILADPSAAPPSPDDPRLADDRTVAQFRAITQLLGHLDRTTASRRAVQARRKRSDLEYLQRFPLYVVPTYPGDERLFGGQAFEDLLPPEVPVVRATLEEVMRGKG